VSASRFGAVLFATFAVVVAASAQPGGPAGGAVVTLQAPAACDAGARCDIVVEFSCPEGSRCTLEPPGRLGDFEVLQVADALAHTGARAWRVTLIAFAPGAIAVPPVTIRVVRDSDGSASLAVTSPATIDVRLPPTGVDDALREAAGPIDPGPDWRVVAAWVVAGLAGLGLVGAVRRLTRRTRPRATPAAAAVTVGQAIERIRALERAPAASPEEVLAVYLRLSDEVRRFASSALAVPAEALTSQELVQAIRAMPRGPVHAPQGRVLLEGIDRVKFGGERPDATGRSGAIAAAVDLVRAVGHDRGHDKERDAGVA
jgi:hypothetical protein